MRKETGFTLIELMVTIALMALFAAFAIPAMNGFVEQQRVNSTLSNYTNALTFARNEAIRQNYPLLFAVRRLAVLGNYLDVLPGLHQIGRRGFFCMAMWTKIKFTL